jgi:hypothetical protein
MIGHEDPRIDRTLRINDVLAQALQELASVLMVYDSNRPLSYAP